MPDYDKAMREFVSTQPVPEFEKTAFTIPPPLAEATVAIVTSAAIHAESDSGWEPNADPQFKVLDARDRRLRLAHWSPNFDRAAFAADLNVAYPVDRLRELAERGVIGRVAAHHYAFAGNQDDQVSRIRLDTGPKAAKLIRDDGVHIVLLTPV
jgi:D-proline reductase (dithiol) PrdB